MRRVSRRLSLTVASRKGELRHESRTLRRYSTEGQREASIQDQYRNCEQFAAREGWNIVKRYADKGISGTKDETGRGGYKALLDAARARCFDVLLVDDLSRLSRDSMKTEEARRLFVYFGVRLIGVSNGIDTASKGHKALSGFKGLMNDIFLDDLRDKTHRGLAGQALKGQQLRRASIRLPACAELPSYGNGRVRTAQDPCRATGDR